MSQLTESLSEIPAPWPHLGEAAMAKAAALGRRDGMTGQSRDFALLEHGVGMAVIDTKRQEAMPGAPLAWQHSRLMLAAVRQCYAAGHHHGGDVRLEKERRRRITA
jgi:hypothetical protein